MNSIIPVYVRLAQRSARECRSDGSFTVWGGRHSAARPCRAPTRRALRTVERRRTKRSPRGGGSDLFRGVTLARRVEKNRHGIRRALDAVVRREERFIHAS